RSQRARATRLEVAVAASNRRRFLAQASAAALVAAAPTRARAQTAPNGRPVKKVHWSGGKPPEKPPLFSGAVSFGDLVFLAGIGAHFKGDIKAHTTHVLDEMQKKLEEV